MLFSCCRPTFNQVLYKCCYVKRIIFVNNWDITVFETLTFLSSFVNNIGKMRRERDKSAGGGGAPNGTSGCSVPAH